MVDKAARLFITHMLSKALDALYTQSELRPMTLSESCVMAHIALCSLQGEHTTVSKLSAFYKIPKSTASDYVARYISMGLVKETIDPSDRRRRLLMLSDAGELRNQDFCDKFEQVRKDAIRSGMPMGDRLN